MSEYQVFVDRQRRAYLQYRAGEKSRQYVSINNGGIDTVSLNKSEFSELIEYTTQTPQHFAEVYLNSFMEISRAARAILVAVLGVQTDSQQGAAEAKFSSGAVSLEEICEALKTTPQVARKHLRKLIDKPGGRWAWEPEQAEKIRAMLVECLAK